MTRLEAWTVGPTRRKNTRVDGPSDLLEVIHRNRGAMLILKRYNNNNQ